MELEILAYNILHGHLVCTIVNPEGAVHLEFALVVEVGQDMSATCQVDVIARAEVHQQLECGVRIDVDVEVDVELSTWFI